MPSGPFVFPQKHAMLVLGFITFGLFLAHEVFPDALRGVVPVLRVLIVPLWGMRTLEMIVGMGYWPAPFQLLIALPLLFAPYVLADWSLGWAGRWWRGHRVSTV